MHQRNWRTVFDSVKPFKVLESIKTDLLCCLLLMSWCLYCYPTFENFIRLSVTRRLRVVYIHYNNKMHFQAWKCPGIFLPFIKYQEFRISFACLLLESKNVKFLILEALSCYVEVKILISVDRARGEQQRAASSARWREGDNIVGEEGCRDAGAYIILQNMSLFGYITAFNILIISR